MNALKFTELSTQSHNWLITGVAGFIGSNILETLLLNNQNVIGIDNFETGHASNLHDVKLSVSEEQWNNFEFHEIDINQYEQVESVFNNIDFVLHQAALGSVPRSINDPIRSNAVNISGFLNVLAISKEKNVKGFIYAASSSTYGDHPELPKKEQNIGTPLSPYAVTKYANELYAKIYSEHYGIKTIGLRYFNVFGKRQDPHGAYAAVIPLWIESAINNKEIFINGDGTTTRDFCYIKNAVEANILAAMSINKISTNSEVMNIAFGESNDLNRLFKLIVSILEKNGKLYKLQPVHRDFRPGDIKNSLADISKAKKLIGYSPAYSLEEGLKESIEWYLGT